MCSLLLDLWVVKCFVLPAAWYGVDFSRPRDLATENIFKTKYFYANISYLASTASHSPGDRKSLNMATWGPGPALRGSYLDVCKIFTTTLNYNILEGSEPCVGDGVVQPGAAQAGGGGRGEAGPRPRTQRPGSVVSVVPGHHL